MAIFGGQATTHGDLFVGCRKLSICQNSYRRLIHLNVIVMEAPEGGSMKSALLLAIYLFCFVVLAGPRSDYETQMGLILPDQSVREIKNAISSKYGDIDVNTMVIEVGDETYEKSKNERAFEIRTWDYYISNDKATCKVTLIAHYKNGNYQTRYINGILSNAVEPSVRCFSKFGK